MVKQRNESIDLYEKGNRTELVDKEKKEIDIILNIYIGFYVNNFL